jgi:hypothetical protein
VRALARSALAGCSFAWLLVATRPLNLRTAVCVAARLAAYISCLAASCRFGVAWPSVAMPTSRRTKARRQEENRRGLPVLSLTTWDPDSGPPSAALLAQASRHPSWADGAPVAPPQVVGGYTSAAVQDAHAARLVRHQQQQAQRQGQATGGGGNRRGRARGLALAAATRFWYFLEASPEMRSNDRGELTDTFVAWRDDPVNWSREPPPGANPSSVLQCLSYTMGVLKVKDGRVIVWTGKAPRRVDTSVARPIDLWAGERANPLWEGAGEGPATSTQTVALVALPPPRMDPGTPVRVIGTPDEAKKAVKELADAVLAATDDAAVLSVDLEFYWADAEEKVSLVQVAAAPNLLYIFDLVTCPEAMPMLKILFEFKEIKKVLHDCRCDELILRRQHGFGFVNVFDTSAADTVLRAVLPVRDSHQFTLEFFEFV